jgi:hypothetical protein
VERYSSCILHIWYAPVAKNHVPYYLWHPDRAHQYKDDEFIEVYFSQVNGNQEPKQRDITLCFLDPR